MEKYSLPSTHELYQNANEFELLVEFYEDLFEEHPAEALGAAKGEDGEYHFEETGDPLLDKWEAEIAAGLDPDLTEGMSDEAKAVLDKEKQKAKGTRRSISELENIGIIDENYDSKHVARGSAEEAALLNKKLLGLGNTDLDPKKLLGYK